ncbi:MAG TPA: MarR family transcriptional regulator [Phycisphaerae bacterium]|nr:MarR family transcriptional regulator [Phycisphaerae bacterium]
MSGKLAKEIYRLNPFDCLEQEVSLNILRTADFLLRGLEEFLKPFGLSTVQFNVLRILRGAGDSGMPCKAIAEHMITRDPDVTRLLDRLAARGLILRTRDSRDRRVVASRITPEGLALLKKLDNPLLAFHRQQLAHVPPDHLRTAIDLMEEFRSADPSPL